MSDLVAVGVAVVLLAANAFFVGAEFALISARRTQIEPRAAAGSRAARTTLRAMEDISLVMAGAQLGITICSLGLGAVGEPAVAHLLEPAFHAAGLPEQALHPVAFAVAMTVVVYLHVVLGEMVPKNLAIAGPERAALLLGPPMVAIVKVFRPVIVVLNAIANGVLRLLRVTPRAEVASAFTREQVADLVEESRGEGLLDEDEYERLAGALGFTERRVEAVLLPREELVTLPRNVSVAQVEQACAATGFSRYPVADEDGGLVGYLHIKDVLETDPAKHQRPVADKWIRAFATVAVDDPLHLAAAKLQRSGAHLARVVGSAADPSAGDGVVGLVALEDVLEELVGEIRDATRRRAV